MKELTLASPSPAWTQANPLRGAQHEDKAVAYIASFPVGSRVVVDRFDRWAHDIGLLTVPYDGVDVFGEPCYVGLKDAPVWRSHVSNRNDLKDKINMAGTHPRMAERGLPPFKIVVVASYRAATRSGRPPSASVWETQSPEVAIANDRLPKQVESFLTTRRRAIVYLLQSADWAALPPAERIVAEEFSGDIDNYAEIVSVHTRQLEKKFDTLRTKLERVVAAGEVQPTEAIRQITEGEPADSAADLDE